jgi:hypothetical protein
MGKDKPNLYFELLNCLSNQGLGVDTNIRDLCNKYVDKNHSDKELSDAFEAFSKNWTRVMTVLESIKKAGYIKYSTEHGDMQQLYIVDGNFSASITKEGLDYYYNYELRKATISSLKSQKGYNRLTLSGAGIAIFISVVSLCLKSCEAQQIIQLYPVTPLLQLLAHLIQGRLLFLLLSFLRL